MACAWRSAFLLLFRSGFVDSCPAQDRHVANDGLQQPDLLPDGDDTAAGNDAAADDKPKDDLDKLMSMDLDQLQNVNVTQEYTPAALTEVPSDRNIVPAAVTHISQEDIWRCGARNLDEVLDIYVPNLEVVRHHWEQTHLGLRGIISDREDKYLLLVNGRIMNDKTHYGAASERLLPMLNDIHHIDVIRGPGSNIYGPGAVSMVIAIYTDTAETFEGTTGTARGGAVDSFTSLELKHGRNGKTREGGSCSTAASAPSTAPTRSTPRSCSALPTRAIPASALHPAISRTTTPATRSPNTNYRERDAFDNTMPLKFFADVTYGDWEVWGRYTRSSLSYPLAVAAGLNFNAGQAPPGYQGLGGFGTFVEQQPQGTINQQATIATKYETELTEDTNSSTCSASTTPSLPATSSPASPRPMAKMSSTPAAFFITTLGDHQSRTAPSSTTTGSACRRTSSTPRPRSAGSAPVSTPGTRKPTRSSAKTNGRSTTSGPRSSAPGRQEHLHALDVLAPRRAGLHTQRITAWKLMANRSQRMNFAEELRAQWLNTGTLSDPEILREYELRLERNPTECFFWAVSAFYIDLDAISWNGAANGTTLTGNQTQWGLEGELSLAQRMLELRRQPLLHQTDPLRARRPERHDLHHRRAQRLRQRSDAWSNHITKLIAQRKLTKHWIAETSLRYYWGFPGTEDIVARTNSEPEQFRHQRRRLETPVPRERLPERGLEYRPSQNARIRVDGYNLLGIFEPDLNHRVFYGDNSMVSEAPAVGISGQLCY